jgi:hypothetical protein
MKTFLLAVIAGVVGAVAGYVVAAFGAMLFAMATGMSNFEGAAGMFAAFAVGPIGGLIGLVLGIVLMLRRRSPGVGLGAIAVRGLLAVAAIVALVAGGIGVAHLMRDTVNPNGAAPRLMFDLRLPPGTPGDAKTLTVELHTDRNAAPGIVFDRPEQRDGARIVVSGSVELYFRTSQRLLVVKRRGEPDRLFRLALSSSPKHTREPSAWQKVDFVAGPGEQPRKPAAGDEYELRYRVAWAGED